MVNVGRVVTRSLWLPVGPANFFSPMTDPELLDRRTAYLLELGELTEPIALLR